MYFDQVCFIELCNIFSSVSKFGGRQEKKMFRINNFDVFEILRFLLNLLKVQKRTNIVHITTLGVLVRYEFAFSTNKFPVPCLKYYQLTFLVYVSLDRLLQDFQIRKNDEKLSLISVYLNTLFRLWCCLHLGSENSCRYVHWYLEIFCWMVRQGKFQVWVFIKKNKYERGL